MDLNADCGDTGIFSGVVGSKGLSSAKKPGAVVFYGGSASSGTWYAIKNRATGRPGSPPAAPSGHATPMAPRVLAGGNYGFYNISSGPVNAPLSLASGNTVSLNDNGIVCTGLWVQSGKNIGWDLNSSNCNPYVFVGTVSAKGLSSAKKPGEYTVEEAYGKWYAVKT
jgi:hypothetical protein